jgi:hypothetical protein
MQTGFSSWLGQNVILQVEAGDIRVPLRGTIVGESDDSLRFRIGDGWDVDIYKAMVRRIEQDNWMSIIT